MRFSLQTGDVNSLGVTVGKERTILFTVLILCLAISKILRHEACCHLSTTATRHEFFLPLDTCHVAMVGQMVKSL
jgi:hypothetical protein